MEGFADDWRSLGLGDSDLMTLQFTIMLRPKGAPVVPGTGGLRKMRFAPARWKAGKRGAARVGYAYLEEYGVVLLIIAYSKSDKANLSAAEKKSVRQLIERVEREFSKRPIR